MTHLNDQPQSRALAGKAEEQVLNSFFVLYKTARLVDETNEVFQNLLKSFVEIFRSQTSDRPDLTIKNVSGHYFVNEGMIRQSTSGPSGATDIIGEWSQLGIGGVSISAEIMPEEIARFVKFMSGVKPDRHDLESLAAQLTQFGLSHVHLLSIEEEEDEDTPEIDDDIRKRFRQMARTTFFNAMNVVQEVVSSVRDDQSFNASKTKRVVHSLIDHITRDEHSLIELTAIRDFDDYTYVHSTNVTVYALTIGVRLGLDRARLSQLGFSGLFHDVGKVKLPEDLIKKPDAFDEDDWVQMQRHPLLGAKTILRNLPLDIHAVRAARAAIEHHINIDFTGYPRLRHDRRAGNLFSRIISVVDTFDALSSGRVYLKKQLTPDQVLKKMRYQMSAKFDPFLLKLFNNIVGVYPAGTLVLLTTDEVALVLTNNESDPLRPHVKIVGDRKGLFSDPVWVDLSLPEHADRKLVRQIEPDRYGLNIRDFVLND